MARLAIALSLGLLLVRAAGTAHAERAPAVIVALAPGATDDARAAIAIGPAGHVYEPDGKGAWTRRTRIATAAAIERAGRAGGAVFAVGGGVVYRLAPNGWSALRLAPQRTAKLSSGPRTVAAIGRQIYGLEQFTGGEAPKLAAAAGEILLIGSGSGYRSNTGGAAVTIATARGLFRLDRGKLAPIKAPKRARLLAGDRWAIVDAPRRAAVDLRTGKPTLLPAGAAIELATAASDERLLAVVRSAGKLALWTLRPGSVLERAQIEISPTGVPVGVIADRAGRVAIAFRDGRIAVRERGAWTFATAAEQLPAPRPGAPPATSR